MIFDDNDTVTISVTYQFTCIFGMGTGEITHSFTHAVFIMQTAGIA